MYGALDKSFIWAVKYPFDKRSIELLVDLEISLEEILSDRSFLQEANKKLKVILEEGRVPPIINGNPYRSFVIFYLQVLIVKATENSFVERRFIDAYSKFSSSFLLKENEENIKVLAKNLGINVKLYEINGEYYYGVPFYEFIKFTRKLSDKFWKIYYFPVDKGFVLLNKRNIVRLLQEAIRIRLFEIFFSIKATPKKIYSIAQDLIKEIRDIIPRNETQLKRDFITKDHRLYPPCIKYLLNNIDKGLSHSERFTLVTFLNAMGYKKEEIIQLFNLTPDFNEKMTRYQVEHILGLRGGKTRYSIPSCRKIVSYGFCKADDTCRRYSIIHPLKYVFLKKGPRK